MLDWAPLHHQTQLHPAGGQHLVYTRSLDCLDAHHAHSGKMQIGLRIVSRAPQAVLSGNMCKCWGKGEGGRACVKTYLNLLINPIRRPCSKSRKRVTTTMLSSLLNGTRGLLLVVVGGRSSLVGARYIQAKAAGLMAATPKVVCVGEVKGNPEQQAIHCPICH